MGLKLLLNIVWLSVCGLPRFGDCQPSWLKTDQNNRPYNGQKVYAKQGSSFTFSWEYSYGGYTPQYTKWKFTRSGTSSEVLVFAYQSQGLTPTTYKNYGSRLTFKSGAAIEIKNLTYPADEGKYECDVTFSSQSGAFELKDIAELIVVVPPKITRKTDGPLTISERDTKTLKCSSSGNPKPRIKWTRKDLKTNVVTNLLDSYNHYGYNITYAQRKDIGRYTCEAIILVDDGKISHQVSYEVTVYVKYKPEVTSLTGNRTLTEGSNVELECTATGDPPVIKYHWYKNKVDTLNKLVSGGKYTITGSTEKSKLLIRSLDRKDADWYYCAAENSLGIGNGTGTYVSARYAPTNVQITYIPIQTVNLSQPVTLKCISDGVPDPVFKWKFKDKQLDPTLQKTDGKNNEMVKISKMTRELSGEYTCKASNANGDSSTKDFLHVNYKPEKPFLTTELPNLGALLNSLTRLKCESDGYPKPKFIIKKYEGNTLRDTMNNQDHILFSSVKFDDEKYSYTCTPFNFLGQGPESSKAKINVIVRPNFIVGLQPSPKIIKTENQTKNYTCIADAKPAPTIKWFINHENVTVYKPYLGVVSTFYKNSPDNPGQIRTESTLVLMPVTWRHDGNISCVASNGAGPVQTYALLEVRHRPVVKNPNEVPNNKTVSNGDSVTFTCFAVGNPAIQSYKWRFNGRIISGATSRTYTREDVNKDDVGQYSCLGKNALGEGPWFNIALFIKIPAKIINHPDVMANASSHVTLICEASGIPRPVIRWYRNNRYLNTGDRLNLYNITYEDRGTYECRAKNELNEDKNYVILSIRVKPNITSNKPTDTQIAGVVSNTSTMSCKVLAIPRAKVWWTRENNNVALAPFIDRVISIRDSQGSKSTLTIRVNRIGEVYHCHAKNMMGYARQKYTIRKKGPPDRPIDLRVYTIKVPAKRTVDVNLTWTAGYSGGETQLFTLLYKLYSADGFTRLVLYNPDITAWYVIRELKPLTKYTFQVQARNQLGESNPSQLEIYTTEASALPPARGTLKVQRIEDGTKFRITWKAQKNVTAVYIQYREVKLIRRSRRSTDDYEYGRWNDVVGAQGLSSNEGSFDVVNLEKDKTYQFRILFKVGNEIGLNEKMMVMSEIIHPLTTPKEQQGLKEDELIAIIAACGGFLLIVIVVVCLCCFMKRKKGYGADSVQMSQTGSAPNLLAGVYDTGTRETNRRSYATSVEDDPFIDAHIASELNKKRRPAENGINHGYASQGIRTGMSQSVGELGGRTSSYSSTGPQRDFSTLPPYNEPPSFEEAIRQSVKKSKYAALSTGDLTEEPMIHRGRSRARTQDSDTSDSDPPLNRRPMFKVKPPVPPNDKRYRSAPSIPPPASPTRQGPRDPSSLYTRPHKKGPPPSYTPEDRMENDYEPRVTKRRPIAEDVMELQEYPTYRRSDRLPDLPPSMPEFSRSRGTMQKEPLVETLPEPPSFLRDLSYEDDEPDGRYPRSYTEPRNRTNRQPYVNIHGQLVRPNTPGRQPTYGSDRQEPIYANDPPRLVAAEPEVPVERRNRLPRGDDEHKPGYVSSGFLV